MNTASEYTVKHVPEYTFQEIHCDPDGDGKCPAKVAMLKQLSTQRGD